MIRPVASNDYKPVVFVRNNSFKGKNVSNLTENYALRDAFKESMITVKLLIYAPFFNDVASIFGRELVYDYETGKLKGIKRYKNKQLVEIKHFYPGTKKVQEVDEYKDGKLHKSISYRPDGKTVDWTVEYARDKDVTKFFYPDGKTPKSIQIESNNGLNRMEIRRFSSEGKCVKREDYKNDVKIHESLYCNNHNVYRWFKDNKISYQIVHFTDTPINSVIPKGDQRKTPIYAYTTEFKDKKPVKTTIHGMQDNKGTFVMGIMEYPDKDTIKLTRYKENGKELYVENINKRTGKRTVTYSRG